VTKKRKTIKSDLVCESDVKSGHIFSALSHSSTLAEPPWSLSHGSETETTDVVVCVFLHSETVGLLMCERGLVVHSNELTGG
jgi:hypothetical protein